METLGSNPEKNTDDILKRRRDQARRESEATQDQVKDTKRAVAEERQTNRQSASESDAKAESGNETSLDQESATVETVTEAEVIDTSSESNAEIGAESTELPQYTSETEDDGELLDAEEQVQSAEELTERVDSLLETVAQQLSDKEEATNEMFRNIRKVTSTAAPAAAFDVTTGEVNEARAASEEFEDPTSFEDIESSAEDTVVASATGSGGGGFRPPILPPNPSNPASPNFGANTVMGAAVAAGAGAALATAGMPTIPGLREVAPVVERRRRNSPVGPFLLGLGVGWLLKRRSANRRINSLNNQLKTSSEQLKKSKQETELLLLQKKKSDQQKTELERTYNREQQESKPDDSLQQIPQQLVDAQTPATKKEVTTKMVPSEVVVGNVMAKVDSSERPINTAAKTPERADQEKFQSTDVLQQIISREAALTDKKEARGVNRAEIERSLKQELTATSDVAEKILQDKSPDWVVAVQLAVDRKSSLPILEQWQVVEIRKKHPELYEKLTKRSDAGVLLGIAGGYTPVPLTPSKTSIDNENGLPSPSSEPQLLKQALYQDKQPSSKTLPVIIVFVVVVGVVLFLSLK